jgi:hypothetical protein
MAQLSFTVVVMTSLSATLLAACGTGGGSSGRPAPDWTDSDWYEQRQDEVGCAGEAQRTGVEPGDAFDRYVSNCVNDRARARD